MGNEKWKVLIVDDEFRIGILIKKLIQWEALGIECLDVVDRGEKAYEIICGQRPDIVITDIRMPKISGLDLIRMAENQAKFIVVSGYKEFEYAHQALQFGVRDYLLKPINQEELNKVLGKVVMELGDRADHERNQEAMRRTVQESEQIIKSNLLNSIIEDKGMPVHSGLESIILASKDVVYRGMTLKLDDGHYDQSDFNEDETAEVKVIEILEGCLGGQMQELMISTKAHHQIHCLLIYPQEKTRNIKEGINEALSRIQEYLIRNEQYEVTVGIGHEVRQFDQIRFTLKAAHKAVDNRIRIGTGRLIYAEGLAEDGPSISEAALAKHKDALLAGIESFSRAAFSQGINELFAELQFAGEVEGAAYFALGEAVTGLFFEHVSIEDEGAKALQDGILLAMHHCSSIPRIKELLKDRLGSYLDQCLSILEREFTKPIREAIKYVDTHFGERILLEDIAERVGLNPVYFSVLFKKEVGMNFSSYLMKIRIKTAKELIRMTNDTIASIADQVGYSDSKYFSQVFTKHVGVKPALYRKLYS